MGQIEGIGEIVTGGLIAGAVEPATGRGGSAGGVACLNCESPLLGAYCWECGQKARVHRSLATFLGDMVQGLFNFEGKIWHTLPMLAWRPGEMTRRYIDGQRARFVSPVALYLFTVFLMFAVLNFTGSFGNNSRVLRSPIELAANEEREALAKLVAQRKAAVEAGTDVVAIDAKIAKRTGDVQELERIRRGDIIQVDGLPGNETPAWLRDGLARIQRDPQAFIAKVQDAASKFSWLLIPLSVPFLWLLFPFSRRFHLYDHTVFVTYSLSFMMMLVVAAGILVSVGAIPVAGFLFFVPPIHMYRQLRGAYGLGRVNALVRTFLLLNLSFIVATLFGLTLFTIGLFD